MGRLVQIPNAALFLTLGLFSVSVASAGNDIVITSNLDTTFTITGPATYTKADAMPTQPMGLVQQYAWKISNVPAGTYTITYAQISGHWIQAPETITIPTGFDFYTGSTAVTYKPTKIEVSAEPEPAPFTITGPVTYSGTAPNTFLGPWKAEKAPAGQYTITWEPLPGYDAPRQETKTLSTTTGSSWDAEIRFTGYYKKQQAQATVTPAPVATAPPAPRPASPAEATPAPETAGTVAPIPSPARTPGFEVAAAFSALLLAVASFLRRKR